MVLLAAALVTGAVWLLAAGIVYLVRRPPKPSVGPRTLDLGPEPPAVANFLVNDFRVTNEAAQATLLDLAARRIVEIEQRGPGVYYVRLRRGEDKGLTAYELRVLRHLRRLAKDGVVPAEALTTGPGDESKRWRRAFEREVVADSQSRGLSRDKLDKRLFTMLTIAALVPAALIGALSSSFESGIGVFVVAFAILGWIRARHSQEETEDGLAAASRWLGVRAELAEDEVFGMHTPIEVAIWDRHLAYGAALGLASGAVGPLPMGTESDRHAWSTHGGAWRPVEIRYSTRWPIGWGRSPLSVLASGVGMSLVGGFLLYVLGLGLFDEVSAGRDALLVAAVFAVPALVFGAGVVLIVLALSDFGSATGLTGPILRLRAYGDDDGPSHYYVAVDDGRSDVIRAWVLNSAQYAGLAQGQMVTASLTRRLRHVRSIAPTLPGSALAS